MISATIGAIILLCIVSLIRK
ncbi:MAG: GlsB/YeaQ/YmgE family stress response membrane protein [Paludibacteraceae bacterium]|nr:GlsB/YeaQ/YmgE family stress response membrane protein [Paludibacteraceae bacterium]